MVFNEKNFSQEYLLKYVLSKNKYPEVESKKARMCLLMDKTISMDLCDKKLK